MGAYLSNCRKRTKQQIDRKYGTGVAKYALCNARGCCVDANHTTDAAARFANDARNTPFENNSIIRGNRRFLYLNLQIHRAAHKY